MAFYIALSNASPADGYDTKYDNINLDDVLTNDRLLKNYVNCLLGEGPCSPDGQELKSTKLERYATKLVYIFPFQILCPTQSNPNAQCARKNRNKEPIKLHII